MGEGLESGFARNLNTAGADAFVVIRINDCSMRMTRAGHVDALT